MFAGAWQSGEISLSLISRRFQGFQRSHDRSCFGGITCLPDNSVTLRQVAQRDLVVTGLTKSDRRLLQRPLAEGFPSGIAVVCCLCLFVFAAGLLAHAGQQASGAQASRSTELHTAAASGDVALLTTLLRTGLDPNSRDAAGRTPLMDAAARGQLAAERLLIASRADVNARSKTGTTALIDAAENGRNKSVKLLIASGANANFASRGLGTALEAAERAGHNDIVAMLSAAGARSSGESAGDTVCVRPWGGDGYCGTVESVNRMEIRIRITSIVGCEKGCDPRAECSAGKPVGGANGLAVGDVVHTYRWCLTQTGVKP
jgi:uncharacterized protein